MVDLIGVWEEILKSAEASAQALAGVGVGLLGGTILGVLLSEWFKHVLRKDEITLKSSLESESELLKKGISADIETLKNTLSKDLEEVRDAIKLASAFKLGMVSEVSKQGAAIIVNLTDSFYKCESIFTLAVGSLEVNSEISLEITVNFKHFFNRLADDVQASQALVPKEIYNILIPWLAALGGAYNRIEENCVQLNIEQATSAWREYRNHRARYAEALAVALQQPA